MMLLGHLGAEWMDAWQSTGAGIGILELDNIWAIFGAYESDGDALCTTSSGLESSYQGALCALMTAIEGNLKSSGNGKIGVRWQDTHASVMPNGRRPDGILQVGGSDVMTGWQNTVAIFELKSSRFDCTCSELRGQLLQGFIDMAEHQPRKHMLGLSVSGAGEVHVYLCSLSEILYAKVGRLPIKGNLTDDGIAVIKLLLIIYTYFPSDYGFLVAKREGIYTRFGLADVFGCSLLNPDMDKNMIVEIRGGKATGGRNYHLVGARSWIYNARVDVDGDGHFEHLVFKFHWHCSGHSEIVVHKEVLGMGIPYVPKLV
ncbi:hypothetical protein H4S08_004467 [Coemansia sp. RSA 1365]|nr:hypothetical protein H4S08_004467 [Coemansia sp. RSA 1365]